MILDGTRETHTHRTGAYYFHSVPEGKHFVEVQYQNSDAYAFTTLPRVDADENAVVNFGIKAREILVFGFMRNDAGSPDGIQNNIPADQNENTKQVIFQPVLII